jgi:hypothetical protein
VRRCAHAAGLLTNSLLRLQRVDSGFRSDRVTITGLSIPQTRYPTVVEQTQFYGRATRPASSSSAPRSRANTGPARMLSGGT